MTISDDAFREEFKPLYVPAHFSAGDNDQDKVIYALAQLSEGTVAEVAHTLSMLDSSVTEQQSIDSVLLY